MKKYFLLLIISVLFLSGCGESESKDSDITTGQVEKKDNIITCTSSKSSTQYELSSTYTIYHDGKYVDYVHIVSYLFSSNSTLLNSMYNSENESYRKMDEKYGGYNYNVTKANNKVVSDVTINYSQMNLAKLVSDDPSLSKYIRSNKMLIDGVKDLYIQNGAKCE